MNVLLQFASTFAQTLFLGLTLINFVSGGPRLLSLLTSISLGAAALTAFGFWPSSPHGLEFAAYLLGGPFGILTSIAIHPLMVRALGRRKPSTH